ncbi:MAG: tyrosine-protein phosphatase [Planctomycetota bacterium]|nr:tyrosine-protein phosphatase [Planctomycetota bacterium]
MLALAGCLSAKPLPAGERPAAWAAPIEGHAGLPNLFRVDDGLIRGAQPAAEGIRELGAMGVRTIVNLRLLHGDDELLAGSPVIYRRMAVHSSMVDEEDLAAFLRVAVDPQSRPVFVHCHHGSDRTGAMVAAYRVVVQGWPRDEAIAEMTHGGFGFHPVWGNLVHLIRTMDVERVRRLAGLPAKAG